MSSFLQASTSQQQGEGNVNNAFLQQLLNKLQGQQAPLPHAQAPATQQQLSQAQTQKSQQQPQSELQELEQLLRAQLQQLQQPSSAPQAAQPQQQDQELKELNLMLEAQLQKLQQQPQQPQTRLPQQQQIQTSQPQQGSELRQFHQLQKQKRQEAQVNRQPQQQDRQQNHGQQQGLPSNVNVNNLLLQLMATAEPGNGQQSQQQQFQQVGMHSFQGFNNSGSSVSSYNTGQFGFPLSSNNSNPMTGLEQLYNMNQLSQPLARQNQAQGLGNLSLADLQRLLGQQQQQNTPGAGNSTTGMLRRPEQFTNQDRLARSGLSVVSDESSGSGSNKSNSTSSSVSVGSASRVAVAGSDKNIGQPATHGEVDPSYPMTDIEYPGQNDCMFGRGGGTSNHIGNINFRLLVEKFKKKYAAANKADKPKVTDEVVAQWRARKPPGRFLSRTEPEESMSTWFDVGDKRARRKCAQALREKPSRCGVDVVSQPATKKQKVS